MRIELRRTDTVNGVYTGRAIRLARSVKRIYKWNTFTVRLVLQGAAKPGPCCSPTQPCVSSARFSQESNPSVAVTPSNEGRRFKSEKQVVGWAAAVLLLGNVAAVSDAGVAGAVPAGPIPLNAWPGCPENHPEGLCHWCPGDPQPQTGNLRVYPVVWDWNVCHTSYYVYSGPGQRGPQHLGR